VALVSSGDAGVHGMAARTLALAAAVPSPANGPASSPSADRGPAGFAGDSSPICDDCAAPLEVVVVPGVTAALAVAPRVGAPLGDDWATLSLSDLHAPWATIERRLTALASCGIALALYNPRSSTRTEPFDRALEILLAARPADTPVIIATDVARE